SIAFALGDNETPPTALTVGGSSSNLALVPNASIVFGGAGANRTVTVTPAANQFGTATITVTVTDGDGAAATDTFVLTVNAVNDAPSFTAANPPTINEDAGTQTVAGWATFSPGPANESGQVVLAYTVSNVSNLALFTAPPAVATNGTLTYTLAANAFGTSTFTVVVQDNGGVANAGADTSAAQTFTIT